MNPELKQALQRVAVQLPHILLPAKELDHSKFATVACDQYVSQPEYWEAVEAFVGDAPSTLRLMLPEAWLEAEDRPRRIREINATMEGYLAGGRLRDLGQCFVYVKRQITTGIRHGLMLALDLEQYDYHPGADCLIRASEQTIPERLPPRVAIRRGAAIETSHVMVLIDDEEDLLFSALEAARGSMEQVYDFDLMQGSGRIEGYAVREEALLFKVAGILAALARKGDGLLFAAGDGNHSLATAKAYWEELKPSIDAVARENHPARYALVEIVNLHDEAMVFEPIHRVIFNVDRELLKAETGITETEMPPLQQMQPLLDAYLKAHPETTIDYVHGADAVRELGSRPGNLGLLCPPFDKAGIFDIVRSDGVLVKKSFSLGEAPDKRFYLECRRIRP
ncbi:MAG: DUF1015 domain-containing protein [Clostridia bacterium]|nr:DUF1015 domain-containing protein [Clostridia bacterium]